MSKRLSPLSSSPGVRYRTTVIEGQEIPPAPPDAVALACPHHSRLRPRYPIGASRSASGNALVPCPR